MKESLAKLGKEPLAKSRRKPSAPREPSITLGKNDWMLALSVAALLHLAVAAMAFWSSSSEPTGQAKAAGTGGVEISLGPAGSAVGGPRDQQGEDTPELTKEPAPAEPVQKAKPESVQETEPISEKKPNPLPETPIEPVKKNEPVKNAVTESRSEPKPETTPVKDTAPPTKASVAGDAGKNGSKNQNNTGSGDNSAGGGLPGDAHDYAATLLAWLEQYKEYPRRARLRRQQGTVLLYFMVDRQGQVLDYRIEKSSGYPALDEEVKKLIERAQPLPAMPDTMKKNSLALVVPVQYFLR